MAYKKARGLERQASFIMCSGLTIVMCVSAFLTLCSMPKTYKPSDDLYANHHHSEKKSSHSKWKLFNEPPKREKAFSTFLAVLILTEPKSFQRRNAIRTTWLHGHSKLDVVPFFSIGLSRLSAAEQDTLRHEENQYHDMILLDDLQDSYYNLTEKVLRSIRWLDVNVKHQFLLKTDDDVYARLDVITQELRSLKQYKRYYWGFFDGRARVKRTGKWAERSWVLCEHYLPHAKGGGYVISGDLVHYLASSAPFLKRYNSEDVAMGTWLAPLDITRKHDPRFDTEYRSRGCNNAYVITHKHQSEDIRRMHTSITMRSVLCEHEFQNRKSYVYDWSAPPLRCCARNDSSVP